jgi:hypothetical protein
MSVGSGAPRFSPGTVRPTCLFSLNTRKRQAMNRQERRGMADLRYRDPPNHAFAQRPRQSSSRNHHRREHRSAADCRAAHRSAFPSRPLHQQDRPLPKYRTRRDLPHSESSLLRAHGRRHRRTPGPDRGQPRRTRRAQRRRQEFTAQRPQPRRTHRSISRTRHRKLPLRRLPASRGTRLRDPQCRQPPLQRLAAPNGRLTG